MMSGGIHDFYLTDLALHLSHKKPISSPIAKFAWNRIIQEYQKPIMVPNVRELFEILKYAVEKRNVIGCSQINVISLILYYSIFFWLVLKLNYLKESITSKFGVMNKHQYLISDVGLKNEIRYVKIHNPHNKPDAVKKFPFLVYYNKVARFTVMTLFF